MNTALIQSIFRIVVNGVDTDEWKTIEFKYKADDLQSEYQGSYTAENDEGYFSSRKLSRPEKNELSELMRKLRDESEEMGGEPFTHCTLKFEADGSFNVDLNYEPIDWSVTAD